MANFFTRALDVVTPWNRGGEVQRRQQRKKKEDEERRNRPTPSFKAPQQTNQPFDQQLKANQPANIFETLNKGLTLGQPNPAVPVFKTPDVQPVQAPRPGTVVQPTKPRTAEDDVNDGLNAGKSWQQISRESGVGEDAVRKYSQATRPSYGIKLEKPKQSLGNRFRDVFDTNTESDKFRRQEGNNKVRLQPGQQAKPLTIERSGNIVSRTPIVGHVTKTLNTLAGQAAELPATVGSQFATAESSAATEEYTKAVKSGDKKRIAAAKQRMSDAINRVDSYNRQIEAGHDTFQKNDGGLFNAGTLYDEEASQRGDIKTGLKDIAAPTAVSMLDLFTLGQGAIAEQAIKQGGLKVGARVAAPNIGKAALGNYASGDLSVRAEGGSNAEAVKSGLINSILGLVPDIGLPALGRGFKNRVVPQIFKGRGVNPADVVEELDDAAISASAEGANQALRPRPIPVREIKDIPVQGLEGPSVQVPVRTPPRPGPRLIKELEGDFNFPTFEQLQQVRVQGQKTAADEFNSAARPDLTLEGVTPRAGEKPFVLDEGTTVRSQDEAIDGYATMLRDLGEGNGVNLVPDGEAYGFGKKRVSNNVRFGDTGGKRISKQDWRDEAERQLKSGQAEPGIQKAFDDAADPEVQALLTRGEQAPVPEGRPITVKQANSIPVTDQSVIPQNLPETPGTVRATTSTAPMAAKTEAVANAPVVTSPASLPAETQAIHNPKQYNKRQVAATRNQRKLARQMAKTTEQTAEAADRIETASPAAASGEGFTPTGEFARSQNGGTYQKASRAAEMQTAVQETSQLSPADVLQSARKNQLDTGGFNRRDIRNIAALFETKRIPRGTPEWNEARAILKEDGTVWGQTGALRNYTMRRNASTSELISRYESKIYRLADDPTKIDGKWFDDVEAAEDAYVVARDDASAAYNEFTRNPTSANAKRYHAAQDVAESADKAAKQAEYSVANKALKGNKDVKQIRELDKMANDADLYQMDAVDASMLSGTGTFMRNFVNSAVGGIEETLFGGGASRIVRKMTGQNVGGGVGRGTLKGFGEGVSNLRDVAGARASNAGKNPLEHLKNWATTGNQLGDTVIDSQVKHNVIDHYTSLLKDQGYAGRELTDRASVMARQDPDNLAREYAGAARVSAGLGAGITRNNKVETLVKNLVSDAVSAGKPTPLSEATGKLVARMTIGFPTAIGRSTVEGVKRFTLGAPTFIKAARQTDPLKRSLLVKEGIKQAGTGTMVLPPMFYALGASGMISGAYPADKETRAQWEREGKTENSIKIGDAWYQLPAYLGAWAVPGLFYASLGRSGGNFSEAAADSAKAIPSLLPTDQASNWMDVVNGRTDLGKFMAQTGASTVRAVTPAGALLNQVAKSFDPTKNDTNTGTNLENFFDKVMGGIPGVNNAANIPDKTSDTGDVITNPNPLEIFTGAASDVQGGGEQRSQQIQSQTDKTLKSLTDGGLFDDPNIKEVLDDKELGIYNKIKAGKKLKEGEIDDLRKAMVKGVSSTGDDTAYLEREQYDSNLRALKLKRELMNADKTVKPSDVKKVDTAIKRGEVYKDNKTPYEMIDAYKTTGITEWRNMGDPESDEYDPEMYQKLYDIDHQLTEKGVSYKKGSLDKPKYTAKGAGKGKGSGGKGTRQIDTDFGKLKDSTGTPRVKEYSSIDSKSGGIPIIRTVRPNIVHKISSSG